MEEANGFEKQQEKIKNLTREQRAINGRKGSYARSKAIRERKATRDLIEVFLAMPLKAGKVADTDTIKNFMALKGKNVTVQEAIQLQLIQRALKGDLNAWDRIINIIGDKPSEKIDITGGVPVILKGEDDLDE